MPGKCLCVNNFLVKEMMACYNSIIIFNFICMNYKALMLGISAIVLLGAGCSGTETNVINSKPAGEVPVAPIVTTSTTPEETVKTEEKTSTETEIVLKGKAVGKQMVQFNWTLPEGAKDPSAFHIVRSQKENPTQPPGYWFMQPGKSRGAVWVKLPTGEQHFRICTWENNKCETYSNDVMVNVE